jgi:hypothetical protein
MRRKACTEVLEVYTRCLSAVACLTPYNVNVASIDVQAGGSLANANTSLEQASNFSGACVGANCNGDFVAAMGFSFFRGANEEEVITLSVSHTDPCSGLRLEDTHPVDGCNANGANCTNPVALNLFISGSAATCEVGQCGSTPPPPVPEPVSLVLMGTIVSILGFVFQGRFAPGVK